MATNKLEITTSVDKKGNDRKNIDLKAMDNGDTVVILKTNFKDGIRFDGKFLDKQGKPKPFFVCSGEYNGQPVGFFIGNEDEYNAYCNVCDVGESVEITFHKEIKTFTYTDPKTKKPIKKDNVMKTLTFKKV
jgi:hypothetical protein